MGKLVTLGALLALTSLAFLSLAEAGLCDSHPKCRCTFSGGYKVADCSGSGLREIPTGLTGGIQKLIMNDNPLNHLESNAFVRADLADLQRLELKNCNLRYVNVSLQ